MPMTGFQYIRVDQFSGVDQSSAGRGPIQPNFGIMALGRGHYLGDGQLELVALDKGYGGIIYSDRPDITEYERIGWSN